MSVPSVFENFASLIEGCEQYIQRSGYRFKLDDEKDEVTEAVIEVYRSRLVDGKEPILLTELNVATRMVTEHGCFKSMKSVCQSIELWHENPAFPPECVHWQDLKHQSMEAVAAQFYNFMQQREELPEETILMASFISDFGYAFGLKLDKASSKKYMKQSQKFVKKASKYAKRYSKDIDTTDLSEQFKKWVEENQTNVMVGLATGIVAMASMYMISKKFRK